MSVPVGLALVILVLLWLVGVRWADRTWGDDDE